MGLIEKLKKMLETMSPDDVVKNLNADERLELSRMITDMQFKKVIDKTIEKIAEEL